MIKSLSILNYQSHKNTRLEFAAGVNALVGTSDSGKSAALRALLWLATNRPSGDAFRSTWGGETCVDIEVSGDVRIQRVKANKENEYRIQKVPTEPFNVFKAIGQDVPAEVLAALGLTDICVQHQMDSPFLLSNDWSPGRVAAYLNEVAGLDAIDRAQAGINARARQITADLNRETADLAAKQGERDALDYLQDFEAELVRVETAAVQASVVRRDEQALNALLVEIAGLQTTIRLLPNYRGADLEIGMLEANIRSQATLAATGAGLQIAIDDIAIIEAELDVSGEVIETESQVLALIADNENAELLDNKYNELNRVLADIDGFAAQIDVHAVVMQGERLLNYTRDQYDARNKMNAEKLELIGWLGGIYEVERLLTHNGEALADLEAEWTAIAPDTCPLCDGTGLLK